MNNRLMMVASASVSLALSSCGTVSPPSLLTFDKLQKELADRVQIYTDPNGKNPEIQIVVMNYSYPIGTLLRPSSSIPFDYEACKPLVISEPKLDMPSLNTKLTIDKSTAANIGLSELFKELNVNFKIDLDQSKGLSVAFNNSSGIFLGDTTVAKIKLNETCKKVINGQVVNFVRGTVSSKRSFSATSTLKIGVEIGATKVGDFVVTPINNTTNVNIDDAEPKVILGILERFGSERSLASPSETATGSLSIIADKDIPQADTENLAKLLQRNTLTVTPVRDTLISSQMPKQSEVRYFNEIDKTTAEFVLKILQLSRPNAQVVRLGIQAPKGQIEVWYTKD